MVKIEQVVFIAEKRQVVHDTSTEQRKVELEKKKDRWERHSDFLAYLERYIDDNGFTIRGFTVDDFFVKVDLVRK